MSKNESDEEDTLSLSFLDVLCCGLGATIYLFLIFSIMPHLGESGRAEQKNQLTATSLSQAGAIEADPTKLLFVPITVQIRSSASFEEHELVWEGLPDGGFIRYNLLKTETQKWTSGVIIPTGLKTKGAGGGMILVRWQQKAHAPGQQNPQIDVVVCVGGSRQEKKNIPLPRQQPNQQEPLEVFQIDLLNKDADWIQVHKQGNP